MKNKKTIQFFIITIVISIVLSFLLEVVFFNRNVVRNNKTYSPEIVEINNIIKNGNKYITNKNSYIKLRIKDNYINKLQFDYKTNKDIDWQIKYDLNGEELVIYNASSKFITKASRKINISTDYITISFNNKSIISNIKINNSICLEWTRILFFTILFSFITILIRFRKKLGNNLDKTFILIALVTGFMFILITPKTPYNSWDDQIHVKNAQVFNDSIVGDYSAGFQLLVSHDVIDGGKIQSREEQIALYKEINKLDKNTSDMQIQINNYSPKYNKLIYLPFKVGFVIADWLHLDLITAIILAKLLNLIVYTLIISFAIKISSPSIKKLIFVIGLLISNIFLASQFSYDPTITASLLLAGALFIRMLEDKEINYKYLIAFILAVIWASLPKAVYCLFGLLVLFIPNKKFKNNKQAIEIKLLVTTTVLILLSSLVLPMLLGAVSGDTRGGNTDASSQLSFILHNPLSYAMILIKFIVISGPYLLLGTYTFVGAGYILDRMSSINSMLYIISMVYVLYVVFTNSVDYKIITNRIKIVFVVLIFAMMCFISTALYIVFTEVASPTIAGVQARYFIGLLLPLMVIMSSTKKDVRSSKIIEYLPVGSFTILMIGLFFILRTSFGI